MRRLLTYYLKKRLSVIATISAIVIIIGVVTIGSCSFIRISNSVYYDDYAINSPLWLVTWTGAILATIVPAFEFYFKMRKVSVDEFYQLPIKREKLYLTKYLVGLIETLIPTVIAIITVVILIAVKKDIFDTSALVPYFFSFIGVLIVYYTTIVFAYTRANTFFDGLINIVLYSFVGVVIYSYINSILITVDIGNYGYSTFFFIQSPMTVVHSYFTTILTNEKIDSEYLIMMAISCSVFSVLGIVLGFLTFYLVRFEKAEDSMQKSTSWFSYKTLIPLFVAFLLAYVFTDMVLNYIIDSLSAIIIIPICGYIAYVIYNRSFKITKFDLICFGSSIVCGLLVGIISNLILH